MTNSGGPVLLLSGAGLPAWIWDAAREALGTDHETVVASRPDGPTPSLSAYVDAALDSARWDRFAVVAHSSGGVVGTELARRAHRRVTAVIGVSAVVPAPGGSFVSSMPFPQRHLLSLAIRLAGTRPPDGTIRRGIAAGLDDDTAGRIVAEFVPESPDLYRGRAGTDALQAPTGYVTTTQDRELSPGLQRRFAARLGTPRERSLATGHLPMLEDATGLAGALAELLDQRG